jgi:hypothetical protein
MMVEEVKVCSIIRDEMEGALFEMHRKTRANRNTKKIQSRERLNLACCINRLCRRLPGSGIVTSWTAEVRFPAEVRDFSLFRSV